MSQIRTCDCGCGRHLKRRPNEASQDFERRKYFSRECPKNRTSTYIHQVQKDPRKPAVIHPVINMFLSGRVT